ncbi:MAG: T9SS type A sorting domain-containing protein [Lentimicrobium sp.]|nr:T9SS type A sorting domain-containing protein [Lentimicrobium sp.]
MRYLLAFIILSGFLSQSYSQPFVNVASDLMGIGYGAVAFADFDNDGDLDLILAGQDQSYMPFAMVYRNDNGVFLPVETNIPGLENCAVAIADYNLDGWPDIAMTGVDTDGNKTLLLKNTGNWQFQLVEAGFYNAGNNGDLAWGDYNNDGFPDLVISGNWLTRLYANNGDGSFSEVTAGLVGMNSPSLAWVDCDNDGDIDLMMVGDAGSVAEAWLYVNENGTFTQLETQIQGAVGGDVQWGDYDSDGNPDILITGKDTTLVPVSYVYRNNGDRSFRFSNAGLVGTALGPANWIDFDNDGDLDIMLSGQNAGCGNFSTRLYTNNGIGDFTEISSGLTFAENAASAWGDFDNDGDFDLVLTGISGGNSSILYRNDLITGTFQPNTPPTVPAGITTYVSDQYAVIGWNRSTDLQSSSEAITYNVMMGRQSGGIDVVSPMANPVTGHRYIAASGNCGSNDFMIFRNLEPGDYFFRVQAIDQAYAGSAFSGEVSFSVLPTETKNIPHQQSWMNHSGNLLTLNKTEHGPCSFIIANLAGQVLYDSEVKENQLIISTIGFSPGIYVVRMRTADKMLSGKFIR